MALLKMSLSLQMAIATVLGILCGLFFGDLCAVFSPWASAYIMLLKVTAIPYLIGAIMLGVGKLTHSQAKDILKKGVVFIGIAWVLNIIGIYLIAYSFPQVKGVQHASYISTSHPPSLNFAEILIPENIFYSLANNIIPAVVVFSLLIGIALMHLKEKQSMMGMLEAFVDALTRITGWIARITPIGTFLIIANQIGTIQFTTIKQVSTYIILYILGVCIMVFWVFPRLTSMMTNMSSTKWLKDLLPILLLAYTTNVVIVCIPYIIALVQRETEPYHLREERVLSQIQGTVSIVFNLPLGSLFIAVFVFFLSVFYNTPLGLHQQVQLFVITFLSGLGAVGLGSWINSLTFILDSLALPMEGLNMYLITLPFTAGFQSMLSAIEIATLALLITLACRKAIHFHWRKAIGNIALTAIPVILVFIAIKLFNPLPQIQNKTKSIYDIHLYSGVPVNISSSSSNSSLSKEDPMERILSSKILRVGYNTGVTPYCFINNFGEIVGYDVAFAYRLAEDLNCSLELVPLNYATISEDLASGKYDIGMSAISIDEERLKKILFCQPYIEAKIVFVYINEKKEEISSVANIRENSTYHIAVLKGSIYEQMAKYLFPDNPVLLLNTYNDFTNAPKKTILLWEEQEAIAWILCHPSYRLAIPAPLIGIDTLGYAMNPNAYRFQSYINQWLSLKKAEGFTQEQYNVWILGKTNPLQTEEKRWSIIRNVFHWID